MPRSTLEQLVGEDPCIPLTHPCKPPSLGLQVIKQAWKHSHPHLAGREAGAKVRNPFTLLPTFPLLSWLSTGMDFLLALQTHMGRAMQRGLEVVLALKIGFAGILNGQSALAGADTWTGWCSVRNSLRELCLYLLSMTYDPPPVTSQLHTVKKLFI